MIHIFVLPSIIRPLKINENYKALSLNGDKKFVKEKFHRNILIRCNSFVKHILRDFMA